MKKNGFGLALAVILSGLIGGFISSLFFMGNFLYAQSKRPIAKVIEAEEFRLVDKDGIMMAKIGRDSDGWGLNIYGKDGKKKIAISESQSRSQRGINFYDNTEKLRAIFALTKDSVELTFADNNNTPRVSIELRPDGAGLYLNSKTGKPYTKLLAFDDTSGIFLHQINTGIPRGGFTVGQDESIALNLFDSYGRLRAMIALDENGTPLQQFGDKNQRVIWKAP